MGQNKPALICYTKSPNLIEREREYEDSDREKQADIPQWIGELRFAKDERETAAFFLQATAKVERAVAGIMAAIEDGLYQPAIKARMAELEREKADILARLADTPGCSRRASRYCRDLQAKGRQSCRHA